MTTRSGQSIVESSFQGFASMVAIMATILVSGQIYDLTAEPVYEYLLDAYGDESMAKLGMYAWVGAALACVFFLARALLVLALILIAQRVLVFAF